MGLPDLKVLNETNHNHYSVRRSINPGFRRLDLMHGAALALSLLKAQI